MISPCDKWSLMLTRLLGWFELGKVLRLDELQLRSNKRR
jgi:hypothetical protein